MRSVREMRIAYSKHDCGWYIHNTYYHQGHCRPRDQTNDPRRDAFQKLAYARLADELLQRIVREEGEGKGGQEYADRQHDRPRGSASKVTDKGRKDDKRCGQQTGERKTVEELRVRHPGGVSHGILLQEWSQ